MNLSNSTARLAVFIDADNASPQMAEAIFDEITTLGEAGVRRIYGDFSSPHLRGWSEILTKHALIPHQQFAYTKGKNATDIALVIDAMDLLHKGGFHGFCLVSSDSDFTRLASRIREEGVAVYGFGEEKTPESFRRACTRFIYIENLIHAKPAEPNSPPAARHPPSKAVPLILKTMEQCTMPPNGWLALGQVGTQLAQLAPDFDPRSYGHKQLNTLVEKTGAFDTRKDGNHIFIRQKANKKPPAPKTK